MEAYSTRAFGKHDFEDTYSFYFLLWDNVAWERLGSMILRTVLGYNHASGCKHIQRERFCFFSKTDTGFCFVIWDNISQAVGSHDLEDSSGL